MNKRKIGVNGEDIACNFLVEQGHRIIRRNYRDSFGEIDIISDERNTDNSFGIGKYIVFTEVKYRTNDLTGYPADSVIRKKQKRIVNCARHFLYENKYTMDTAIRFDVISICGDKIEWIKNAFEA